MTRIPSTLNGKTQRLGVIGWPITHTFSPAMHNAALRDLDLNYVYLPLPVHPDDLTTAVSGLSALDFRGFNITVPHKQAIMPLLDEIEAGARAIGAVNTVVVEGSLPQAQRHLKGSNTDWSGFLADLDDLGITVNGRDTLVLGAGGSARAIVYALATAGARVQLLARRPQQAAALRSDLQPFLKEAPLQVHSLDELDRVTTMTTAPLIVNTTPLGMTPQPQTSVWPEHLLFPEGAFVYDLVYNPLQTKLMHQAQAAGCRTANGLGMLVQQGARAFTLWTGQSPSIELMRAVFAQKEN